MALYSRAGRRPASLTGFVWPAMKRGAFGMAVLGVLGVAGSNISCAQTDPPAGGGQAASGQDGTAQGAAGQGQAAEGQAAEGEASDAAANDEANKETTGDAAEQKSSGDSTAKPEKKKPAEPSAEAQQLKALVEKGALTAQDVDAVEKAVLAVKAPATAKEIAPIVLDLYTIASDAQQDDEAERLLGTYDYLVPLARRADSPGAEASQAATAALAQVILVNDMTRAQVTLNVPDPKGKNGKSRATLNGRARVPGQLPVASVIEYWSGDEKTGGSGWKKIAVEGDLVVHFRLTRPTGAQANVWDHRTEKPGVKRPAQTQTTGQGDAAKDDAAKDDAAKDDAAKDDAARDDAAKDDAAKDDAAKDDAAKDDAAKDDAAKDDAAKDDANKDDANKDDANKDDAAKDDANKDDANKDDADGTATGFVPTNRSASFASISQRSAAIAMFAAMTAQPGAAGDSQAKDAEPDAAGDEGDAAKGQPDSPFTEKFNINRPGTRTGPSVVAASRTLTAPPKAVPSKWLADNPGAGEERFKKLWQTHQKNLRRLDTSVSMARAAEYAAKIAELCLFVVDDNPQAPDTTELLRARYYHDLGAVLATRVLTDAEENDKAYNIVLGEQQGDQAGGIKNKGALELLDEVRKDLARYGQNVGVIAGSANPQRYTDWAPVEGRSGVYQTLYQFRPDEFLPPVWQHRVLWFDFDPDYYYFYSLKDRRYWGRYNRNAADGQQFEWLPNDSRTEAQLGDVPYAEFGQGTTLPKIPFSVAETAERSMIAPSHVGLPEASSGLRFDLAAPVAMPPAALPDGVPASPFPGGFGEAAPAPPAEDDFFAAPAPAFDEIAPPAPAPE